MTACTVPHTRVFCTSYEDPAALGFLFHIFDTFASNQLARAVPTVLYKGYLDRNCIWYSM